MVNLVYFSSSFHGKQVVLLFEIENVLFVIDFENRCLHDIHNVCALSAVVWVMLDSDVFEE